LTPLATDVSEVPAAPILKLQGFVLDVSGSCKMLTPVCQTIRCHVPAVRHTLRVALEMCLNVKGTVKLGCQKPF